MKDKSDKKVAAIQYSEPDTPTVIAKGTGLLAEQILEIAEKHQVFIHEDPILVDVLSQLKLGEEIPEHVYKVVARIIAFAYMLQEKYPEDNNGLE